MLLVMKRRNRVDVFRRMKGFLLKQNTWGPPTFEEVTRPPIFMSAEPLATSLHSHNRSAHL